MSQSRHDELERDDLLGFISAALACTGQREFYGDAKGQAVSIGFFHDYVLGNYRRMYAHCLAAGINDFNRSAIIVNLLSRPVPPTADRREEGRLIAAALAELPPQRVLRIFVRLVELKLNNRRTRRIVSDWLAARRDPELTAVKYRRKLARIVAHFHLRLPDEHARLLFRLARVRRFDTPLFESFRRARHDTRAIYELPYTVAEGFAARHRIPRERFLAGIAPRLTERERLRLQSAGRAITGIAGSLAGQPLTRLAIYWVSLSLEQRRAGFEELDRAMRKAAERLVERAHLRLGRVALVADNSWSASGSPTKRDRPLAIALATHYVLQAAAEQLQTWWTTPVSSPIELRALGHTDLASPIVAALREQPSLLVVVSDGYDNDPPGGAGEVVRVFRERLDPRAEVSLVHLNPVYDASEYATRGLAEGMPTIGIRDVESLPTLLEFSRFLVGRGSLAELQNRLELRAADCLARTGGRSDG